MTLQPLTSDVISSGMLTAAPEIPENVFVAGDLAWYPVRHTQKRTAPDVMNARFICKTRPYDNFSFFLENCICSIA